MKIAICLSGHLRNGDINTYDSLKRDLLDKYDCDIFISSWKETGLDVEQLTHKDEITDKIQMDVTDRILQKYKPKYFNIESKSVEWLEQMKREWGHIRTRNGARLFQIMCMFRKIYDADLLRRKYEIDTGQKYDIVIRHRFDVVLPSDIIKNTEAPSLSGSVVCKLVHYGLIDLSFWGTPEVMSRICDCYLHIPKFVSSDNSVEFENAETILKAYVALSKIPLYLKNDMTLLLIRSINGGIKHCPA